jgi:hypothetical protein
MGCDVHRRLEMLMGLCQVGGRRFVMYELSGGSVVVVLGRDLVDW